MDKLRKRILIKQTEGIIFGEEDLNNFLKDVVSVEAQATYHANESKERANPSHKLHGKALPMRTPKVDQSVAASPYSHASSG